MVSASKQKETCIDKKVPQKKEVDVGIRVIIHVDFDTPRYMTNKKVGSEITFHRYRTAKD